LLEGLDIKRIPNIVEDPNVISSIIVDISIIAQKNKKVYYHLFKFMLKVLPKPKNSLISPPYSVIENNFSS